jgi:hypothetical protein
MLIPGKLYRAMLIPGNSFIRVYLYSRNISTPIGIGTMELPVNSVVMYIDTETGNFGRQEIWTEHVLLYKDTIVYVEDIKIKLIQALP